VRWWRRALRKLFGAPRRPEDKSVFHRLALIPFLAWVGMGADGLSSSAYGPEEAFRALGRHGYLALPLAVLVAATVALISACYMRIIEKFPSGGGGYVVATKLLSPRAGLVAACALVVDYILTIAISIAAGADALLSIVPAASPYKVPLCALVIAGLVVLNIRGTKESVTVLVPIFLVFVFTHLGLILVGLFGNLDHLVGVMGRAQDHAQLDLSSIGLIGIAALLARAYSMGAGTFTGIEAVTNGMSALREPRIENGKRTMFYMAASLAFTAAGILVLYLLAGVHHEHGKTLNAVLAERVFGAGLAGRGIVALTLAAEGALLLVAAQTGFIGEHGGRLVDPAALLRALRAADLPLRRGADGRRRDRDAVEDARQHPPARRDVQHQRVRRLRAGAGRHAAAGVARAPGAAVVEAGDDAARGRPDRLRADPGRHRR
jgi:amino acid transporter